MPGPRTDSGKDPGWVTSVLWLLEEAITSRCLRIAMEKKNRAFSACVPGANSLASLSWFPYPSIYLPATGLGPFHGRPASRRSSRGRFFLVRAGATPGPASGGGTFQHPDSPSPAAGETHSEEGAAPVCHPPAPAPELQGSRLGNTSCISILSQHRALKLDPGHSGISALSAARVEMSRFSSYGVKGRRRRGLSPSLLWPLTSHVAAKAHTQFQSFCLPLLGLPSAPTHPGPLCLGPPRALPPGALGQFPAWPPPSQYSGPIKEAFPYPLPDSEDKSLVQAASWEGDPRSIVKMGRENESERGVSAAAAETGGTMPQNGPVAQVTGRLPESLLGPLGVCWSGGDRESLWAQRPRRASTKRELGPPEGTGGPALPPVVVRPPSLHHPPSSPPGYSWCHAEDAEASEPLAGTCPFQAWEEMPCEGGRLVKPRSAWGFWKERGLKQTYPQSPSPADSLDF
ncbi:hypothetical protein Cadr_000023207 [Camelus dromedarius]|uniref:Uncharacterized protein n=1 Tax=Camelus dromedarius TaxID=9838 RepID=A0A5N4CIL8_CAMDR|nr:hypothetical protein Cadr_000023207 [Camelus dromedarius]